MQFFAYGFLCCGFNYLILPVLVLSVTSCAPPSTILVALTSVSFASLCKSVGILNHLVTKETVEV